MTATAIQDATQAPSPAVLGGIVPYLQVNGGSLMLGDPYPEHGCPSEKPQAFNVMLPVKGIDAWWSRAVAAGCEIVLPLQVMFWGDRYGQLRDPYGVAWAMNEPVR